MSSKLINRAIVVATTLHSGQVRKGGNIPYILHPLEAGTIAGKLCSPEDPSYDFLISAAILHDTVEDTPLTMVDLGNMFPKEVVDFVKIQTEDKTQSWDNRKSHTMQMLKDNNSKDVEILILADKLSNLRAIAKDFEIQGNGVWERFSADKYKQEWYYSTIMKNLKLIKYTDEFKEYEELLKVFK